MERQRIIGVPGGRTLPVLYAVTDRQLAGMAHPDIVRELLRGGCRCIQIRDKDLSDEELFPQIAESVRLCRQSGALLIVNDRPGLAARTMADGVHLGQEDTPPGIARQMLGPRALIGRSAENMEQAIRADQDGDVDYVAIGPVFATLTKKIECPPLGVEESARIRARVGKPLVAIGGISLSNAAGLIAAGIDSLAVVSGLMAPPPITRRTEAFIALLGSLRQVSLTLG